jgi:hypothetical protein
MHASRHRSDQPEQPAPEQAQGLTRPAAPARAPAWTSGLGALPAPGLVGAAPLLVQRAADEPAEAATPALTPPPAGDGQAVAPAGWLVEDGEGVGPGQMGRSAFLAAVRAEVCRVLDEALAGTPYETRGCPYVEYWLAFYADRSAAHIERALRRYTPEAAGAADAETAIAAAGERVRRAAATWRATGRVTGLPEGIPRDLPGAPPIPAEDEQAPVARKATDSGAAPARAAPVAIQRQLGPGRPLDGGVRARMEPALGADLSGVRTHTDAKAARLASGLRARAFAVGEHVAFAAGAYRPGTPVGDALIAHELAHTLQQRGGAVAAGGAAYADLEQDADSSAVGAVARLWGRAAGGLQSVAGRTLAGLRSGLRLQRCSDDEEEQTLLQRLSAITDPRLLESDLRDLTAQELTELREQAPAGSLLGRGVRWEQALRQPDWPALARLHRDDRHSFFEHYWIRVVDAIMAGSTSIQVRGDASFTDWVRVQFEDLAREPVGFRLIVELLATGQAVTLRSGAEHTTERVRTAAAPDLGRMVLSDASDNPLPVAQQRRGTATGSTITLNPALSTNQVTVGGRAGNLSIIEQEAVVTFGHELIHALHNARGENIAPPDSAVIYRALGQPNYLVRNPVTGEPESPEELRTISGQTSFQAPTEAQGAANWPLRFNLPAGDISENALRRERGLPERVGHHGGQRAFRVAVRGGETLEQVLARYSLEGGQALPTGLRDALRSVLLEWYPHLSSGPILPPTVSSLTVDLPHGGFMSLHLAFRLNQPDLAGLAHQLRVRGG